MKSLATSTPEEPPTSSTSTVPLAMVMQSGVAAAEAGAAPADDGSSVVVLCSAIAVVQNLALDEAALLLKSFTRDEAELGARAPLPRLDGFVFVLFIAAQLALNWALRLIIARPLANFLLATPDRPTRAFRRMVVKFSQACLELLVYGSFALIGLVIVPSQPWFWPSKHWWIGFADGGHEVMRDDLRCYYLLYGARYVAGFVNVLLEPKRKDFVEMLAKRRVDFFTGGTTPRKWTNVRMTGEFFTTVSSLNAFHPVLDVVAGGNSSGKVSIWR